MSMSFHLILILYNQIKIYLVGDILEQTKKNVCVDGSFMCLVHHYHTTADKNRLVTNLLRKFME